MSNQSLDVRARRLAEEVINQGDLAVAGELVAADYVHHVPGPAPAPGISGLTHGLTIMRSAFPDFHVIVEDAITQGDRVMVRLTAHGTHQGPFLSAAPTGRKVTFEMIDINRAAPDGSSSSTGPRSTATECSNNSAPCRSCKPTESWTWTSRGAMP